VDHYVSPAAAAGETRVTLDVGAAWGRRQRAMLSKLKRLGRLANKAFEQKCPS